MSDLEKKRGLTDGLATSFPYASLAALHCKQNFLIFLTFWCFIWTGTNTTKNRKKKKKGNTKIHLWSVFFKRQQKYHILWQCECPLSKHRWMISVFKHVTQDPHFSAIACRAATSRACALLTKNLEWSNSNIFSGFSGSVNDSPQNWWCFQNGVWAG